MKTQTRKYVKGEMIKDNDFILKAVNAYEPMIEALDSAYALLTEFSDLSSWNESDYKVLKEIEKALKLAEGK